LAKTVVVIKCSGEYADLTRAFLNNSQRKKKFGGATENAKKKIDNANIQGTHMATFFADKQRCQKKKQNS